LIEGPTLVKSLHFTVLEFHWINFEVILTPADVPIVLVALVDVVFLLGAFHHGLDLLGQLVRQNFATLLGKIACFQLVFLLLLLYHLLVNELDKQVVLTEVFERFG